MWLLFVEEIYKCYLMIILFNGTYGYYGFQIFWTYHIGLLILFAQVIWSAHKQRQLKTFIVKDYQRIKSWQKCDNQDSILLENF